MLKTYVLTCHFMQLKNIWITSLLATGSRMKWNDFGHIPNKAPSAKDLLVYMRCTRCQSLGYPNNGCQLKMTNLFVVSSQTHPDNFYRRSTPQRWIPQRSTPLPARNVPKVPISKIPSGTLQSSNMGCWRIPPYIWGCPPSNTSI